MGEGELFISDGEKGGGGKGLYVCMIVFVQILQKLTEIHGISIYPFRLLTKAC